jgi:hypothetical protein
LDSGLERLKKTEDLSGLAYVKEPLPERAVAF